MIRLAILAFALGAALMQLQPRLPPLGGFWLGPLLALLAWKLPRQVGRIAWLLLALGAGFHYAAWRSEARLHDALPQVWEGRTITLQGRVRDLPETTPEGLRFQFAPEAPGLPGLVRLSWRGGAGLQGGDCLRITARLFRPHGQINPGGFDYEAWLWERGIRAVGRLTAAPQAAIGCGGQLRARLDATREFLRQHLRENLGERPHAGVVRALAIGEQDAIDSAGWTLFRQTGVTHLMSISGLHVTLFAVLVHALVTALWRRHPALMLQLPAHRAGILLGLLAAAGYTALAGFGIPAQRTLYMLLGAALPVWLDRDAGPTRLLASALLLVLLLDPWAALAPGFWLSFGAVAALLLAGSGRIRPLPAWKTWLRAQGAITLALTPPLLALFQEVSLVAPLANAFAIPLISLVAVPASLAAAALPLEFPAVVAHAVVAVTVAALELLARLPQPVFHAAAPGWPALLLALAGAGLLLSPRGLRGRWLGLFLFLPLFFPRLPAPASGELWLTALDVGQGEAILLRTARHALLYDAGPAWSEGEDAGSRIIAPALWSQGIRRLDALLVSHDDSDHSGGALAVTQSHAPGWLLTSLAGVDRASLGATGRALLTARPDARACVAGQSWTWDGVTFRVLHPPLHQYGNPHYPDNERSCVLRVETPHGAALLTGDVESLSEANLLERRQPLAATLLIAAHHGSRSSSGAAFLAAARPAHVIIPVGQRNRFGHPHGETLARYRDLGAEVRRTDRLGAVTYRFTAAGLAVEGERARRPRYWRP